MTLQEKIAALKAQADIRLREEQRILRIPDADTRQAEFYKLQSIAHYGRITCTAIAKRPNTKGANYVWYYDGVRVPGNGAVERYVDLEMARLGDLT